MTIKRQITEEEWSELANADQDLYEPSDDGYKFIGANPKKVLVAKNHEKKRANEAKQEVHALREQINEMKTQLDTASARTEQQQSTEDSAIATMKKQVEGLQTKMAKKDQEHLAAIQSHEGVIKDAFRATKIKDVASQLFGDAHIGELIVRDRVHVDLADGKPQIRYKDRSGEINEIMTQQDFMKDLSSDDRYAKYTAAKSNASGGGDPMPFPASGVKTPNPPTTVKDINDLFKDAKMEEMGAEQLTDYIRKNQGLIPTPAAPGMPG